MTRTTARRDPGRPLRDPFLFDGGRRPFSRCLHAGNTTVIDPQRDASKGRGTGRLGSHLQALARRNLQHSTRALAVNRKIEQWSVGDEGSPRPDRLDPVAVTERLALSESGIRPEAPEG